ncbi:acetyl-CoA carboxylase carboxyltransferase subunit alpha [Faunimonas pinastri]|uniref:Acetyl-coenzyme A carboxylase carboxyl transferase subunit alpha n=1 Tax=Faunimonas pinastri TaxID=1855383 RepID=A0A1H9C6L9_9HYPH|nr:acetyl-CoA carboxylase carboxyltransferase subunit alpha [Faunimonas pinastri]SEP96880.1 acetyl-CoA carboxylase carboxyltransferase subunit alpha [Faunimonas pinastri]
MRTFLDFEKPVADLMGQIQELRRLQNGEDGVSVSDEIATLEEKAREALKVAYSRLTPWQKTQVARHPDRPHAVHYIAGLIDEFTPLAGDRKFSEDQALIAGFGRFKGQPVAVLAQEKGADTQTRLQHNFGMARPEGYRKAVRIMELAQRFKLPVISLVDTAGAYPGVNAEERGQAEAIARSTEACLNLRVPNVAIVLGEGGSGGAIAIATANRVFMLEHAVYSVISPEGAASILWRDSTRAQDAATAMKITAADLQGLKVIDGIIPEPLGGAHRAPDEVIARTGDVIERTLSELSVLSPEDLVRSRRQKFLDIGRTLS